MMLKQRWKIYCRPLHNICRSFKSLWASKLNSYGFTLIEAIVAMALLSAISVSCAGVMISAFSAKHRNDEAVRSQVAIRQALLAVTREIRKEPEADGANLLGPVEGRYAAVDGLLIRRSDGLAVAKDIAAFTITPPVENKVKITITSINGQEATTVIYLRVDV